MACKNCKCPDVSDEYLCTPCIIVKKVYKFAVITAIDQPNLANEILVLNREEAKDFCGLRTQWSNHVNGWLGCHKDYRSMLRKRSRDEYVHESKIQVFSHGEVLMVDPWFGRSLTCGRCPRKWCIEYQLFDAKDAHKAYELGRKVSDAYWKKKYP